MIYEYECSNGHRREVIHFTLEQSEAFERETETGRVICDDCLEANGTLAPIRRVDSVPGQAILYGEGFYKPAASGATSYRRSDPSKAAQDVIGDYGAKNLVEGVKANSK